MNILNMHVLNVIRRSAFKFAAQDGIKFGLFLTMPSKVITCRTLMFSCLKKNASKNTTDNLDLDGWKDIVLSGLQKQAFEEASTEDESNVAAIREYIEMSRLLGKAAPENISEEQLKKLIECTSKTSRIKYLAFLASKERKKKSRKEKKDKLREEKEEEKKLMENAGEFIAKNTFLRKIWSSSVDVMYNWRAAQSMVFGQPLVFDMDYEDMSEREMQNTVKQMMDCEGANRKAIEPFHLHYCNLRESGPYHKEFINRYGDAWNNLLVTVTERSYAEIFPRNQIVYLTADSPNILETFDHNKIYIIGCLVDKTIRKGVSFAHAKRLNLETARLPLEKYFYWETGAKVLTLDQMMMIMLTLKQTGNWKEAFQFVPKRKHAGFTDSSLQQHISTWQKTKMYKGTRIQEKSFKPFAKKFSKQQMQNKWWEG